MSLSSLTIKLDFDTENGAESRILQTGTLPTPFTENVNMGVVGAAGADTPPVPSELFVNSADATGIPCFMDSVYINNSNANFAPSPLAFGASENEIPSPLMNVGEAYYDISSVPSPLMNAGESYFDSSSVPSPTLSLSMLADITDESAIPEPENLDDPGKKNRIKK